MKQILKISFALFVLASVVACTTPYKRYSVWDEVGYSDVMLDSTRAQVAFVSNADDKDEAVVRGAMLRAAELAKEHGFDAFVVTADSRGGSTSAFQTPGTFYGQTIGGQTFGSFVGGMSIFIEDAKQVIAVQFFKRAEAPPSAFDADDVIKRNRPFFQK